MDPITILFGIAVLCIGFWAFLETQKANRQHAIVVKKLDAIMNKLIDTKIK